MFDILVHLHATQVKVEYQGYGIKVKVTTVTKNAGGPNLA